VKLGGRELPTVTRRSLDDIEMCHDVRLKDMRWRYTVAFTLSSKWQPPPKSHEMRGRKKF
jgi:hypothetical protein